MWLPNAPTPGRPYVGVFGLFCKNALVGAQQCCARPSTMQVAEDKTSENLDYAVISRRPQSPTCQPHKRNDLQHSGAHQQGNRAERQRVLMIRAAPCAVQG